MPEIRFIPATRLEHYALYQIPHHSQFAIECLSCGVLKDIAREYLSQVSSDMSLAELSPLFRCTLCGAKNAKIMAGGWSADSNQNPDQGPTPK